MWLHIGDDGGADEISLLETFDADATTIEGYLKGSEYSIYNVVDDLGSLVVGGLDQFLHSLLGST